MTIPSMQVDSLLSQVTYPYKGRVRSDVVQLMQKTSTLRPSIGEIVHNDGTRASLLMLDGTIPMYVANVKYNAPVAIYIVYNYPEACPLVYVRPVAGMIIKPGHPYVDYSGFTRDPYLSSWRAATSALSGLVDALSRSFSNAPPVYARPSQQPQAQAKPTTQLSHSYTTVPDSSVGSNLYAASYMGGSGYTSQQQAPPAYQQVIGQGKVIGVQKSATHRKDELIAQVTTKLQEEMTIYYSRVRDEIDKEFACQSDLSRRRDAAVAQMNELVAAKQELQSEIEKISKKKEDLEQWVAEHTADIPPLAEDLVTPYDGVSSQLTSLLAENLAIDDVMYYLERALASKRNKTVDLPIFLREVRSLSGKQFTNKLHLKRIHAVVKGSIK